MDVHGNQALSARARVASFLAAVAIVYFHVNSIADITSTERFIVFEQSFVHLSLMRWAVPFFFAAAVFWFSQSSYVCGLGETYVHFILKKARVLLVPYVIFSVLGLLVNIPRWEFTGTEGLLDSVLSQTGGGIGFIDNLLGVSISAPKFAGHLWFVRYLLVLFLIAPLWKALYRKLTPKSLFAGSLLFCVVARYLSRFGIIDVGMTGQGAYFFCGLAIASLCEHEIIDITKVRVSVAPCAAAYVLWAVIESNCVALTHGDFSLHLDSWLSHARVIAQALFPLVGIVIMWQMAGAVVRKWPRIGSWHVLTWSFLIYCIHYLFWMISMPVLHYLLGNDGWRIILISCIETVILFAPTFVSCWILVTYFPRVASLLSGGRVK